MTVKFRTRLVRPRVRVNFRFGVRQGETGSSVTEVSGTGSQPADRKANGIGCIHSMIQTVASVP